VAGFRAGDLPRAGAVPALAPLPPPRHRPLGHLILLADGLHNLIGGLAIGAAFVADTRLGIVTWLVAAAH